MRPLLPAACLFLALAANACAVSAAVDSSAFTLLTNELQRVSGTYLLEDGHVVHIVGTRRHPRAEFDDRSSQPLEALSATDFLTLDGCTRLHFDLNENATLARIRITRTPACAPR